MRTIGAFSGKRGGYGAYLRLMRQIEADDELDLLVLLGDMHVSEEFGRTENEARRDFPADRIEVIEMGTGRGDSARIRGENLASGMHEAVRILDERRPDVVLVHGDRGEHLVVALAALTLGIVVAHTQGGDRSGNIDEIQRHAITKLAHLHFPETEEAAERLHRMGEDDWRIHVVGSTYVDRIVHGVYAPADDARASVGLEAGERFVLVLVHPETYLDRDQNRALAHAVCAAAGDTGLRSIVTYPCSDPGYEGVLATISKLDGDAFIVRQNVDNDVYLGLMSAAEAIVGNSSAALVEAPYFALPAVNVGRRQDGRARAANVIDVPGDVGSVADGLGAVLNGSFRAGLRPVGSLGDGRAAERIVEVLKDVPFDDRLRRKQLAY